MFILYLILWFVLGYLAARANSTNDMGLGFIVFLVFALSLYSIGG